MHMKLLVATTNPGKLREIRWILGDLPVDVLSLADFPPVPEPEETGRTFEENARLKALYYDRTIAAAASTQWGPIHTVAEDSGLVVDAGGQPLPHIGWNDPELTRAHALFADLPDRPDFYFLHSFAFRAAGEAAVAARTSYGESFASVVAVDNLIGVQFHPEKSQKVGQLLVKNFLELS